MSPSRASLLPVFVISGSALMAVGITPQPVDAPQNDDYLVEYRMVHEEIDGGADSGVSPDGKWISFSHSKSGNREIYAISTETGEIKNLTNTPDDDWEGRYAKNDQGAPPPAMRDVGNQIEHPQAMSPAFCGGLSGFRIWQHTSAYCAAVVVQI